MSGLRWLFEAEIAIGDQDILWREVIGNLFGLLSALGGMRRRVWAWPVGIVGNLLLFTVFLGATFDTPQDKTLWGQAGRQIFFIAVSLWGWWRWQPQALAAVPATAAPSRRGGRPGESGCSWSVLYAVGTAFFWWLFGIIGSYGRFTEAWILTGSILATYGMARGWVEFWLIWIAVDAVGVPTLVNAGFYPSAVLYGFYGVFCMVGFVVWIRSRQPTADDPSSSSVDAAA